MKIAICDDEINDRKEVRELLEEYSSQKGVTFAIEEFSSGAAFLDEINSGSKPSVIFLDINMDDMDGLTLAKKIRERLGEVSIVLVTAFINYALDGYKVRANRFLLKDDLKKTFPECMDDICREIQRKTKMIVLSCVEGDIKLRIEEIFVVETDRHKCRICLNDKEVYHIYKQMDELENMLSEFGFLRIHQSYLVNMQHIRNINSYVLTLENGAQFPIPKARYRKVKQEYTLFLGKIL